MLTLPQVLKRYSKISNEELKQLEDWEDRNTQDVREYIVQLGLVSEDDIEQVLAMEMGIDVLEKLPKIISLPAECSDLKYSFAKKWRTIPIEHKGKKVRVAISSIASLNALDELAFLFKASIEPVWVKREFIDELLQLFFQNGTGPLLPKVSRKTDSKEEKDVLEDNDGGALAQLVNYILAEAVQKKASDIHFEPGKRGLQVRFRIDGVLSVWPIDTDGYEDQILTRIKVMANLDIAEHRLPQDGRIHLQIAGRSVDFRVSVVPIAEGQRIALRILTSKQLQSIDELGIPEDMKRVFLKHIQKSEGIFLVTGPTGSGKTTTLYAGISNLNSSMVNIMTIEDPIEYRLEGISQMAVRPAIGLTFAKGLRHLLRQDPDIMMVGEIRDAETAKIAIQSALTGHLVLSTLHTNDAPSAITRLVDMGIENYLLSSCVIGILAQRLVRLICPSCKQAYQPSQSELEDLGIKGQAALYRGEGCDECSGSGYLGRRAIFELLTIDSAFKRQMAKSADAEDLRVIAKKSGMATLRQSGAQLALEGFTTSYEVMRVTS